MIRFELLRCASRIAEERSDEAIQVPFALPWIASSPLRGASQ
jgi:hypothetical protein